MFHLNWLQCNMVCDSFRVNLKVLYRLTNVSIFLDGDETSVQKIAKVAEKARKHALSSSALQHLREEFMDTPAEIIESSANGSKMEVVRERQERQE